MIISTLPLSLDDRLAHRGILDAPVRAEHPRPQMFRPDWLNLNGVWQFEIDQADTGLERGLLHAPLATSILVPFAPESAASGIGDVDFLNAVWYRREFDVPDHWQGRTLLLHFGAVDYDSTVWVDGEEVGRHRGGFASFTFRLPASTSTRRVITVRARDLRDGVQARGKQATWYENTHALYTRTTGIWQTVWVEAVSDQYVHRCTITPLLDQNALDVDVALRGGRSADLLVVTLFSEGRRVCRTERPVGRDALQRARLEIPIEEVREWSVQDPYLYDITITVLSEGHIVDEVQCYAGLRAVRVEGTAVLLNGARIFQRLVLDQGYWPESLMTAPSDEALRADIELAVSAGFNGARMHQKVFEERFLTHADRAGYLLWGEYGDWGVSGQGIAGHNQQPTSAFVGEWLEVVQRDINHPALIGWCPLNETHQLLHDRTTSLDDVTLAMFLATKAVDPTRPVIDASGYSHRISTTDIYDSHSYEQDPEVFRIEQAGLADGRPFVNTSPDGSYSVGYAGQPYFVSEFGGIWWNAASTGDGTNRAESWGYGVRVASEEDFYDRFDGLVQVLLGNPLMFGYCYTQLTDVFQEENGIFTFDRRPKFDLNRIRRAQHSAAAYEVRPTAEKSTIEQLDLLPNHPVSES